MCDGEWKSHSLFSFHILFKTNLIAQPKLFQYSRSCVKTVSRFGFTYLDLLLLVTSNTHNFRRIKMGFWRLYYFLFFVRLRTYFAKLWSLRRQKPAEVNRKETQDIGTKKPKNRKNEGKKDWLQILNGSFADKTKIIWRTRTRWIFSKWCLFSRVGRHRLNWRKRCMFAVIC